MWSEDNPALIDGCDCAMYRQIEVNLHEEWQMKFWQIFVKGHDSHRLPVSVRNAISDCLLILYLHKDEISVRLAYACVTVCVRTVFSHGLRKCRGVIEMALLEYVGRLLFLSLSLSVSHTDSLFWKVYFCRYWICARFLFLDSFLESEILLVSQTPHLSPQPRFPHSLIVITSSVTQDTH